MEWWVWLLPAGLAGVTILLGFVVGLIAYKLGYTVEPDYDEVTVDE